MFSWQKTFYILIFIVIFTMPGSSTAQQLEDRNIVDDILRQQIELPEIYDIKSSLITNTHTDIEQIFPGYDPENIIKTLAKGNADVSLGGIIARLVRYIFKEIYTNFGIIIKIFILAILCSLLKNMQTSFLKDSVGELAFYTCYIVIVSLLLVSYKYSVELVVNVIDNMVAFMHATIPSLIVFLATSGNIVSAGILKPITIATAETSAVLIKSIVIPLIYFTFITSILCNISESVHITKIRDTFKQLCNWSIGIIITVFVAIISIQGALGATVDGVSSKTAKYAIGTFVPIVGKYLADAADAVVGCGLIIKNAAGVAAMIGIITVCLIPILKIAALVGVFRIGELLIEPISDKRLVQCITDMGNSLTKMCAVLVSVAFMFLISFAAIIAAGNISMMIR